MKITKQYIYGYSPFCSCLTTKESYNWWITRRELGFRHQTSEAKYQKMSVANIWKHSGEFRRCTKWLWNFADVQDGCEIISQPKVDFAALRNWPSAWCDHLPMALTSSLQLRFANRLKCWISNFPRFEKKYSMQQMDFKKCSKSVKQLMYSWILHVRFLSLLSSLHSWFVYGKGL